MKTFENKTRITTESPGRDNRIVLLLLRKKLMKLLRAEEVKNGTYTVQNDRTVINSTLGHSNQFLIHLFMQRIRRH